MAGKRKIKSDKKVEPRSRPLTVAEFRSVLEKLKSLGLTWTADITPLLIAEKPEAEPTLSSSELMSIQEQYPTFPLEVGTAIFYALTGTALGPRRTGDTKPLEEKAAVVRESGLLTEGYRSEFFFKHAIKVPYFSDLDWEVVIKTYERNVHEPPTVSYGLLSLELEGRNGKHSIVVAVDERMTDKLIQSLSEVKLALGKSKRAQDIVRAQLELEPEPEEGKDVRASGPKPLEHDKLS